MHYNTAKANAAEQKDQRKSLRRNMTPAEALLWRALRGRGADGWKWRRQQGIGPFVLDFYCPALRLCIELDGVRHDGQPTKKGLYIHNGNKVVIK